MRRILLLLVLTPLLLAAAPQPEGHLELTSTQPVTLAIHEYGKEVSPGWTYYYYVTLECSNGYAAVDVSPGPSFPVVFDETVFLSYHPELQPQGECEAYLYLTKYNQPESKRITYELHELEFEVGLV